MINELPAPVQTREKAGHVISPCKVAESSAGNATAPPAVGQLTLTPLMAMDTVEFSALHTVRKQRVCFRVDMATSVDDVVTRFDE